MIFEAQLMAEAKQQYDKLLARQYNRLKNYAEKLGDEKDEKRRERGQAVLDLQFEELTKFKDWADTAQELIFQLIETHEEETKRAYSKGFAAGEKSQTGPSGFKTTGSYLQYKNQQREQQRIKWADHL